MRDLLRVLLLAALSAGGFAVAGCSDGPTEPGDPPIPNIVSTDLQGDPFLLSDTQGSVVLLSFFQPSCTGCRAEAPVLRRLHEQFADDGLIIVAIDAAASTDEELQGFKDAFDLPYRILYDKNLIITRGYRVRQTPTTYVISRDADLLGPYVGVHPEEEWVELLLPLLDASED